MLDDNEARNDLRKMILFGINRTAVLYNKERITDPERYNFWYQQDHFWFQNRRAYDPAFFRYIFSVSHRSPNFQSNRFFVLKVVLRDLCTGKFNTEQLSGTPDLESFQRKNKNGDYDPRHVRRKLNDELTELVIRKDRIDSDERKISYGTAFRLNPLNETDTTFERAQKLWDAEVYNLQPDGRNAIGESIPITLKEIFPERWEDLKDLQKKMLQLLASIDNEEKDDKYFLALWDEVQSFSPYFIILSNHINSICEISWFMKKRRDARKSIMNRDYELDIKSCDVEKTLSLMASANLKTQDIVSMMSPVPSALLYYGLGNLAVELIKTLIKMNDDENRLPLILEYAALLRNLHKYKEMLQLLDSVIAGRDWHNYSFTFALFEIRYAEALAFNGRRQEGVKKFEEVFDKRYQLGGSYVPYISAIKNFTDFVITEKDTLPDCRSVPKRVSLLINLLTAAFRTGEYCLAKKYLEVLFDTEKDYFKRSDATDSFINLQKLYTKTILLCVPSK